MGLNRTPLYEMHQDLGATLVPFAGYEMPVQYPLGVMKEHLHCRAEAGLFDVSHMGQVLVRGDGAAEALEALMPQALLELPVGRQRYGLLTNESGGIIDDLMIARREDDYLLVLNAACKANDIRHITANLPSSCELEPLEDRALVALQGPASEEVLAQIAPGVTAMRFMDSQSFETEFGDIWVSRSGYTGDDGFEISVHENQARRMAQALLSSEQVAPVGLGARDSLRLEAGLCLYGQDIDTETSPIEADLGWAIQKARKPGGARAGGYPGADAISQQIEQGAPRRRVGLLPQTRAPMRAGTPLFASETAESAIGTITSGGFAPTLNAPISMGYLDNAHIAPGATVFGEVRGKRLPATLTDLPFRPASFKRKGTL